MKVYRQEKRNIPVTAVPSCHFTLALQTNPDQSYFFNHICFICMLGSWFDHFSNTLKYDQKDNSEHNTNLGTQAKVRVTAWAPNKCIPVQLRRINICSQMKQIQYKQCRVNKTAVTLHMFISTKKHRCSVSPFRLPLHSLSLEERSFSSPEASLSLLAPWILCH